MDAKPTPQDQQKQSDEYGQLIQQKQAIVQRQVDTLVDTWISQYAWRADERPKMPKLRQMIAELLGGGGSALKCAHVRRADMPAQLNLRRIKWTGEKGLRR